MDDRTENIRWYQYSQTFPDRYLERSYFDDFKDRMVEKDMSILDIGGGVKGSLSQSQARGNSVWLMDPFVSGCPESYIGKVVTPDRQYDLIIMRGSFNYLVPLEIIELQKFLKPDGKIIFNTFIQPTEIFRPYFKNKKFTGYEKSIYEPDGSGERGSIWHFLIPEKGKIIKHRFFYYPHDFITKVGFKDMAIQWKFDKNTAIYVVQHKFEEVKI